MSEVYGETYFGFVYLWYDKKRRKFCLGSHMGSKEDGYVSYTGHMRFAYRKRPKDFERRILYYHRTKNTKGLRLVEEKWLSLIKPEEFGQRYYNLWAGAWGRPKGYKDNEETRRKKSLAKKGKPPNNQLSTSSDPEVRKKIGEGVRRHHAQKPKKEKRPLKWNFRGPRPKQSERLKGENNPNFGRSEASKHLNASNFTCSRCGKITTKGNWTRWHEEKCKN